MEIYKPEPLQVEDAPLEQTDADFAGILDTLGDPVIVVGVDCRIVRFNQAAAEILGLNACDIDRPLSDLGALSEVKDLQNVATRVMAEETVCQHEIRKGDRWFVVRIASYSRKNGGVQGAVITLTNITAFRASVTQAIYEREYTKTILNTVAQPLIVLDAELRVQTGNRAFYETFGLSREAAQGVPFSSLGNDEWTRLGIWTELQASHVENRQFKTVEVEKDFPLLGRRTLQFDATHIGRNGSTIIVIAVRDITDKVRAKEKLEQTVLERTASLRELITQMEEFSYSVSHDLRSPVRAMHGYAKALSEDYGNRLDDDGKQYLDRIIQGSSRMERLIHDVLTYSRVSRTNMKLQQVSLYDVVRGVLQQYPEFNPSRSDILVQQDLPDVIAHEPSLGQAVANLLVNAVKFVNPGVKPKVLVSADENNGSVFLRIRDNGIGIKPECQQRLFGMFERIHPDGKYEGTGIGLAIVRKTIERMGGKVGVESDGFNGSTFWIQLPKAVTA